MTTILGYDDGEVIYLAADGRASYMNCMLLVRDNATKLFQVGKWTLGLAGTETALWVLREKAGNGGAPDGPLELRRWLRETLEGEGWRADSGDGPPGYGGASGLLAAHPIHGLFVSGSNFGFGQPIEGRPVAVGSGDNYSEGALAAFLELGYAPSEGLLSLSIRIASRFDLGTGGEIRSVAIPKEGAIGGAEVTGPASEQAERRIAERGGPTRTLFADVRVWELAEPRPPGSGPWGLGDRILVRWDGALLSGVVTAMHNDIPVQARFQTSAGELVLGSPEAGARAA